MTTETEVTATEEVQAPEQTIDLNDLYNMMQIMDYAANQGAFKGWETMVQVLNVRTKLYNFLKKNMANFDEVMSGKVQEKGQVVSPQPSKKGKGKK